MNVQQAFVSDFEVKVKRLELALSRFPLQRHRALDLNSHAKAALVRAHTIADLSKQEHVLQPDLNKHSGGKLNRASYSQPLRGMIHKLNG